MGAFNTLNAKLNPICHFLALLGAHHILHVSGISVNASAPPYPQDVNSNCSLNRNLI
jgi:hypothetical protein